MIIAASLPKMTRRLLFKCLKLAILIFAILSSTQLLAENEEKTEGEEEKPKITEVAIEKAVEKEIEDYKVIGGIIKPREVSYAQPFGDGIVRKILIKPGRSVQKGQAIMELAPIDNLSGFRIQRIESPISGVLLKIDVTQGQMVRKGEIMAMIADPAKALVHFSFTEDDKAYLEAVETVKASGLEEAGKKDWDISLDSFNYMVDEETFAYQGTLSINCKVSCLKVFGRYQSFRVVKGFRKVITVASTAIARSKDHLFILTAENTAKKVSIEVDEVISTTVTAVKGVSIGDSVIVGNDKDKGKLEDGEKVIVKATDVAKEDKKDEPRDKTKG